jgi:hypothetical protein
MVNYIPLAEMFGSDDDLTAHYRNISCGLGVAAITRPGGN